MGDLTNNLSRHEFACKCGCGFDTVDMVTIEVIQDVCDHFSCRVNISSGCRCHDHNEAEGGSKGSQHLFARAGDCHFYFTSGRPVDTQLVDDYLQEKYPGRYGFGVYNTFNHIDTRTAGPARWDER